MNKLYTWGYQSRGFVELETLLITYKIGIVVDVRSRAWSRFQPILCREALESNLMNSYLWLPSLGNQHKALPWKRGDDWRSGIRTVMDYLDKNPVLLMCLERDPHKCHRLEVSEEVMKTCACDVEHLGWKMADEAGQVKLFD